MRSPLPGICLLAAIAFWLPATHAQDDARDAQQQAELERQEIFRAGFQEIVADLNNNSLERFARAIDRDDLRMQIDTDDVILRWWNVGVITFYFPELDRLPVTNVVLGIRKKAGYANRIAAVKTMQD